MFSMMVPVDLNHLRDCLHVECPGCLTPLLLDQPDVDLPNRLLGICYNCQVWYLLDSLAGLMAQLPELSDLKDRLHVEAIHS
jgi:hypothetical protein